jgi:hypothetical protein
MFDGEQDAVNDLVEDEILWCFVRAVEGEGEGEGGLGRWVM